MNKVDESIMYLYKSYLVDKYNNNFIPDISCLKKGILIDSNCSKSIKDLAIKLWGKDGYLLNQTFHKSLNTVIKSSDEELYIKQIIHYITTYGFESMNIYSKEKVYIPHEKLEIPELDSNIELINITALDKKDLKDKLYTLITSSIPLSKQTIMCIFNLIDYIEIDNKNINVVKNREIKNLLYDRLKIVPEDNIEFVRYLVYKLTDSTLLIKDKETIEMLSNSDKGLTLQLLKTYIDLYNINSLAEIFNRYKKLFIALKSKDSLELNHIINRLSKLSKIHHKPFRKNDLDNFLCWYKNNCNKKNYIDLLVNKLKKESIWRVIKLRNYISLNNSNITERVYKIRNGRTWISTNDKKFDVKSDVLDVLDDIIIERLKSNVNGKKIYIDKNMDIVIPQSEKQFSGNIPFSSSLKIDKGDVLVGIHWYNSKEKRVDLDLKIISNEYSIGWDADYKDGDKLVFTGDVTNAPYPDGASEYIYISKLIDNTVFSLKVNNFTRGIDNIEYDIVVAKKSKKDLVKNYIVDPNDVIIRIPKNTIEKGKAEQSLGNIVIDNNTIKIIFTNLSTSNNRSSSNNNLEDILRNYLKQENDIKCKLVDYLEKAGASIVDDVRDADLDFSIDNLNKNSIIELLM